MDAFDCPADEVTGEVGVDIPEVPAVDPVLDEGLHTPDHGCGVEGVDLGCGSPPMLSLIVWNARKRQSS